MTPGIMVVVAAVIDTWAGVVAVHGVNGNGSGANQRCCSKGVVVLTGVLWMVALPSSSAGHICIGVVVVSC